MKTLYSRSTMSLFFKNYPVPEDASLLIRLIPFWQIKNTERNGVSEQNTYSEAALERAIKDEN